jgi:hypothetical protein
LAVPLSLLAASTRHPQSRSTPKGGAVAAPRLGAPSAQPATSQQTLLFSEMPCQACRSSLVGYVQPPPDSHTHPPHHCARAPRSSHHHVPPHSSITLQAFLQQPPSRSPLPLDRSIHPTTMYCPPGKSIGGIAYHTHTTHPTHTRARIDRDPIHQSPPLPLNADGTDIGAVVADIGAHSAKLGFAGEDTPRAYFSSVRPTLLLLLLLPITPLAPQSRPSVCAPPPQKKIIQPIYANQ